MKNTLWMSARENLNPPWQRLWQNIASLPILKKKKADKLIYDSDQKRSVAMQELVEVYNYRQLILQMVRRDIVTRYKRSILGVTWTMLNPLLTMVILTVVFSQLFKTTHAYAAYVLSGLIAWNFFSQTTNDSIDKVVWGGGLLKNVYLPRTVLPIVSMLAGVVNLLLSLVPLILILLIYQVNPGWAVLMLPVSIILIGVFALGMSLIVSTLSVFFPDVSPMYQIILLAWMYLTPIFYPVEILPQTLHSLLSIFNPMYSLVHLFRLAVYEGRFPTTGEILPVTLISFAVLIIGWLLYTRKSGEFSYYV